MTLSSLVNLPRRISLIAQVLLCVASSCFDGSFFSVAQNSDCWRCTKSDWEALLEVAERIRPGPCCLDQLVWALERRWRCSRPLRGQSRGPMIDELTKFNARSVSVAHTASAPKRDGWPASGSAWVFMLSGWMNELKDYFLLWLLEVGRFLMSAQVSVQLIGHKVKRHPWAPVQTCVYSSLPDGLCSTQEATFISSSSVFGGQRPEVPSLLQLNYVRAFKMGIAFRSVLAGMFALCFTSCSFLT